MALRSFYRFLFGTLRGRLILGVAAVHALLMALFVADLTFRQRAMLLDRQIEGATSLSQALATSAAGWIAAHDISGLQELVDAQMNYPEVLFALLTDTEGQVLASIDKSRLGSYLLDLPLEKRRTLISSSPALVDIATPAMVEKHHVGWVRVGIGQHIAGEKLSRITENGIIYAVAAILIGSVIAWLMGHGITRRLYSVKQTMDVVRSGNNSARASIAGTDEVAVIAGEFNAMLEALSRQDAELRTSEERYRFLIEKVQTAIILHDGTGLVLKSNLLAQKLLGISSEMLTGKRMNELTWDFLQEDGSILPASEYSINQVLATKEPIQGRITGIMNPDKDKILWVLVNAEPEYNPLGDIDRVIVSFVDITERKDAETKIQEMNRGLESRIEERTAELTAANSELDAFAYAVSHDLRAPLRAMRGFSAALMEDFGQSLSSAAREYLNQISLAGRHMTDLIDGLLKLSRCTRGDLQGGSIDLSAMVTQILNDLAAIDPTRRVSWTVKSGVTAWGDPRMIEVVISNLIGNAWKYSANSAEATIEFGAIEDDGPLMFKDLQPTAKKPMVVCFLRDNGAGFDMRHIDKLFRPFQRLHRQDEFPGIGIGLATVQRIIHRHGGLIRSESAPGKGAIFYFSLPRPCGIGEETHEIDPIG